jgi:hypothetical protein
MSFIEVRRMTDMFIIEYRSSWEAFQAMLLCPFSVFIDLPVWMSNCVWGFKGALWYTMRQKTDLAKVPYFLAWYIVCNLGI